MRKWAENGPILPEQKFPLVLKMPNDCEVQVDLIDWTLHNDKVSQETPENIDFILGADIVYERTLIPPLCNILRTMLEKK